ncbi:hypothetical protein EET67_03610 [Pseudaminobacter arsenicus]|uniref:Uncharacterized protein n=1 Tax=Borborobacter arsenicus TaxID=1851146 RepID=A0A432VAY6_9HYPH|nr:hypothetical protein [Pseudaminobacter arsenicus]RUM99263.1 hypothetical protein EET67_03610 [Pseudaminobacter arsenicus]
MRMAWTIFALLCWTLPAQAQHLPAESTAFERTVSMARLYLARQSVLVDYVAAMRRYEAAVARKKHPENLFQEAGQAGESEPWTWTAANGDTVRRREEGVFIVQSGNYLGNWFTNTECIILEWPAFLCADGQTWKMSAPDPDTVIFGDVEYTR